jgi:hypothetical protein
LVGNRKTFMEFDDQTAYIGIRDVWEGTEPFGVSAEDRRQHVYVIGKTGTGKSTLLRNLILQDLYAGRGVGLIDPHGDLAHDVLDHAPCWRADHIVYFDPADRDHPLGLNLLSGAAGSQPHLVASGVVAALRAIWSESWGARLEYLLFAAVAALCECPNTSLLGVSRMLSDALYRRWVVGQVKDPLVRSFWEREFAGYDKRFLAEVISPVQNKVGQLLMAPPLRNVLGQVRSKIDLRFMMGEGRVLIASLSKGKLGDDKANLLGALLLSQFQLAAMSRSDLLENERRPFHLYLDEFSSYATDSLTSMLSEARKYGLSIVASNQHTAQLKPEVGEAVFGNVGTIIAFRVGESDAQVLEREFGGEYHASRFTGLDNFQVLVKTVANGRSRPPFAAKTIAPLPMPGGRRERFVCRSREKYSSRRQVVEGKITRWANRRVLPHA